MTERFIGVDRSGEPTHPTDHLYYVATRYTRTKQSRWVICLTRGNLDRLRRKISDWQESIAAIMIFKAANKVFQPGYSIQIDRDFHGRRLKKVKRYVKRLFGVVNRGKPYWADPPIEFLPKEHSIRIRDADKKASLARHKEIRSNETDPNINDLMDIIEEARKKGRI